MDYKTFTLMEPDPERAITKLEKKYSPLLKFIMPLAHKLDDFLEENTRLDLDVVKTALHPQEDYVLVSKKYPIFVVADGVTLEFNADGTYPNPSPAGEAAKIFCETLIKEAEKRYDAFGERSIHEVFEAANEAVGLYNMSQGRFKASSNFWDHDLFAATAAFVVMRDGAAYWAVTCDSGIVHFDANGTKLFNSPECWLHEKYKFLPKEWENVEPVEKQKIIRRVYRNGVNEYGELIGYDVVTGEKAAEKYLDTGVLQMGAGDFVALFSDGFEPYVQLPEFIQLFTAWDERLEERVHAFTHEKSHEHGAVYGHERSLIMVEVKAV